MNKKEVLLSIIFLCLVVVLLLGLCDLFETGDSPMSRRFKKFDELEPDTVDAVIVGTSGVDRYWNAAKAYEDYGMTVYPLSTDRQPPWLVLNAIKEGEKQTPELVIIDMRPFTKPYEAEKASSYDAWSRRVLDALPFFSMNRVDAINRTREAVAMINPDEKPDLISHYLTFVKFHTKWEKKSFTYTEVGDQSSEYLGFRMDDEKTIRVGNKLYESAVTEERAELHEVNEAYFYELLDYLDQQEYEVLFFCSPHSMKEDKVKVLNTMCDILDERGYDYLIDRVENVEGAQPYYYDSSHVNFYGSELYMDYFAKYLDEKYDLPDHRGEEAVAKDWDGVYDRIKEQVAAWEAEREK